jgi:hypothetical protein
MVVPTNASNPVPHRSGRAFFWAGVFLCLLGPMLFAVEFSLKRLAVPWFSPALATLAVFCLIMAVVRRRTVSRWVALVLIALFAGIQWYGLAVFIKLPDYKGPVQVGKSIPAFQGKRADGSPFTNSELKGDKRHVLVFFRGRW